MINILIAGDLSPQERVARLFDEGKFLLVFNGVKNIIDKVDYSIVNLESPIVEVLSKPIQKAGPCLKCNANVVNALKFLGVSCVTLANNHFYDYGESGALNTFELLKKGGIDYVGAGRNIEEASKTLYKRVGDKTVAFINCCEHEFSIATKKSAGSNPLNIIDQYLAIKDAKSNADHIIVIVHGGMEMCQLPSPRMVKTYRFFIEAGADVVVNHHQHCYSGYEYYHNKPIIYGLGNFCFDWKGRRNSIWNEGYLLRLSFDNKDIKMEIVPYEQCNEKPCINLECINKQDFFEKISELNNIISNKYKLEEQFNKFLSKSWNNYECDVANLSSNRYLQALFKRGIIPSLISEHKLRTILNAVRCESHRDRMINSLLRRLEKLG